MAGQFLLTVPYQSQASDLDSYAGAQVIRMITLSLPGGTVPDVATVYSTARASNDPAEGWPKWYIDPLGMQHGLYGYDPRLTSGFPGHWRIYTNPGQPAANNQVQSTLKNFNTAAAVLVNGGMHWVCVVGYTYDDSNKVTSFIIHDPAYDGGGAYVPVAVDLWNNAFTPVGGGTRWLNQITEVGDPQPIKDVLEYAPRRSLFPGDTLIDPGSVVELALEGARQQFGGLPNIRAAIKVGRPGEPRLVARLDMEGSYYYIVPLQVDGGRSPSSVGAIVVDARYGDVLSASGAEEPFSLWPVRPRDVRSLVTRSPIPVYDSTDDVASELLDRFAASRWGRELPRDPGAVDGPPIQPIQPIQPSLRETIASAIASYALPRDYLHLTTRDIVIDPIMAWAPCRSVSLYHPYYVVRTPWRSLYVNAFSSQILTSFDICGHSRLGA